MTGNLSVSWDEYQKNVCRGLSALQHRGEFVDMTIAADGHHVKVHQMVLALVSPFIKDLITSANCPHPVIFLNKVSHQTMVAIVEYAYSGEAVVGQDKIGEFLQACKDLHIKGLENMLKDSWTTNSSKAETQTMLPETEREDGLIPSNSRKRKKREHDEKSQEVFSVQFDGDDFNQDDAIDEVEVKTDKLRANNQTPNNEEDSAAPLNLVENVPIKKQVALQYSVSAQGNMQIMVNRYLYAFRHMRKSNERFWRCISQQKTSCPAVITTYEDTIMQRSSPHNHPFHDVQILKRVKNGNMFTSIKEVVDAAAAKKQKNDETDMWQQVLNDNKTG